MPIEGYLLTVCQDVNGTPCFVRLHGNIRPSVKREGIDSENVQVSLGDANMLGTSAMGCNRIKMPGIPPCRMIR